MVYTNHIKKEYEEMYSMADIHDVPSEKKGFIERNAKIYEGIDVKNLGMRDITVKNEEKDILWNISFYNFCFNIFSNGS